MFGDAYLGHNRLSIITLHITERHLGTFVLVDLQVWVVNVWDLVDGYCAQSASDASICLQLC